MKYGEMGEIGAKFAIKQIQLMATCRALKLFIEHSNVAGEVKTCCDELNALCDDLDKIIDDVKSEVKKDG